MKKLLFTAFCLFALMATSASLKAQEITINLSHGWTWISYTRADTLTFAEALGYFIPANGDVIKSQNGSASFNNGRWRGTLRQFYPGLGYMYYSSRTEPISFVYTHAYQPEVSTGTVSGITTTSATVGGNFLNDGGATMKQCGICWGTNENPTINNNVVLVEELTTGEYALELANLIPGTTYHARAFATNTVGTTYGEDVTFTTTFVLPTVTTDEASWVTTTTAIVGGQFSFVGNCVVTECGVCYRIEQGEETCLADSTNASPFSMNLTDLLPNTTYIVRAYATNGAGTAYGEEKTFTTLEEPPAFPDGAIDSKFTVNAYNGQVYFSQGNLQYIGSAADPYWKFAEYQWYRFGETTGQNSTNEDVDRDLFGWGTSGYDHGANCYQPWSTSTSSADYYAYGNSQYNLYDQTGQADWGYNAIANGGNQENSGWRTLTKDEWYYVFNTRTDAASKYGHGCVNGVNGMVLLPDEWILPEGLSFTSGNSSWANVYTAEQWVQMEANGAVFLPVSGYRRGTSLNDVDSHGWYWTSSYDGNNVYNVKVHSGSLNSQHSDNRYDGNLVRLVRNTVIVPPSVTTYSVTGITNATAIVGGQITDYGGVAATEYGICYRMEQGEETCVAANGINNNTFWKNLQDLTPNTTYIVRAYATNGEGTSYGEEMSFTTLEEAPTLPQGIINGLFTINSNDEQVYFSQGNLQYTKSTQTWSFMEHQYDVLGTNGQNVGEDYANTDIVSYFGWGTSGCNLRNTNTGYYYQPYNTLDPDGSYYGTLGDDDLTGDYANGDWGVYNPISNGGNVTQSWRTLSKAEWDYVFEGRTDASSKWGRGNVAGVNGVILLPDVWAMPMGLTFIAGPGSSFDSNTYTEQQWTAMQTVGAVFLPAAGWRTGAEVSHVNDWVDYWTVSSESNRSAYNVWVTNDSFYGGHDSSWRHRGYPVRMVRNAE
jgi:hypothetical protein